MRDSLYQMMSIILGVFLMIMLWPLIKWLIIIILLVVMYGIFKFRRFRKKVEKEYYSQTTDRQTFEEPKHTSSNPDIIDVEYSEREVKDDE